MTSQAMVGYGTVFSWKGNPLAELTRIGKVDLKASKLDATSLDTTDNYADIRPGRIDPGDVPLEGWLRPDDTNGQVQLLADMVAKTLGAWEIKFPDGTSLSGNGYITGWGAGEETPDGLIPFSGTLSIAGATTFNTSGESDGLSALTGIEENAGAALTLVPTFGNTKLDYVVSVNTLSTWVKVTPTAAAHTITVSALGVSQTVNSGAQSGEINIGAAGTVTKVTIKTQEVAHSAKTYNVYVARA